jgi:hypothetical protein
MRWPHHRRFLVDARFRLDQLQQAEALIMLRRMPDRGGL